MKKSKRSKKNKKSELSVLSKLGFRKKPSTKKVKRLSSKLTKAKIVSKRKQLLAGSLMVFLIIVVLSQVPLIKNFYSSKFSEAAGQEMLFYPIDYCATSTSYFSNSGLRFGAYRGTTGSGSPHDHAGVDIMHKSSSPTIYAFSSGTIQNLKSFSGKGYSFWLHNRDGSGFRYYYTHVKSINSYVRNGATVTAGQILGKSGGTNGGAWGDHLHFGVTKNGYVGELPLGSVARSNTYLNGVKYVTSGSTKVFDPYPILKNAYYSNYKRCGAPSNPLTITNYLSNPNNKNRISSTSVTLKARVYDPLGRRVKAAFIVREYLYDPYTRTYKWDCNGAKRTGWSLPYRNSGEIHSFSVSGLKRNALYQYSIKAQNDQGVYSTGGRFCETTGWHDATYLQFRTPI